MITNLFENYNNRKIYNNLNKFIKESSSDIILNEVYFEEGLEIKNMLKLIKTIREPLFDKKILNTDIYFDKISSSKDVISLNRAIENFFGFKTFALKIVKSDEWNAWTVPISGKLDIGYRDGAKYIKKTNNGFKFTGGDYNVVVNITSALLCEKKFNERDIMAILLHEIGHNFSFAIDNMGGLFGTMIKASNTCSLILDYINIWIYDEKSRNTMNDIYYNNKDNNLSKLADHLNKKDDLMINLASIFMKPAAFIFSIVLHVIVFNFSLFTLLYKLTLGRINPIDLMIELYGYNDEKVADNFAVIYGFGPESAKFEEKVYTMNMKEMSERTFYTKLLYIIIYPFYIAQLAHDPHPKYILRILDQLKILNNELEKEDIDPKMKTQIKNDIKNIQSELNKLLKSMDKYDTDISSYYDKLMMKLFGGDFREIWFSKKDYNKQYDDI